MRQFAMIVGVATVLATASAGSAASAGVPLTVVATNGKVVAYGSHFRCEGDCGLSVPPGSSVLLQAEPTPGFRFTRWAGACRGKALLCAVSPKSATTARAFYTPKLGNVLIAVGGSGTVRAVRRTEDTCNAVSAGCLFSRPIGSTVELAAVPAAGGSFGGWGGACAGVSGQVCRVLVHKGARQVSAAFATTPLGPGNQQQLTVQAASIAAVSSSIPGFSCPGEQQCTTSVPTGTLVELLPDKQSYAIASTWSGGCTGYGYTCGLVVDGPVTVKSVVGALAPPHPKSIGLQVNVVGQGTVTDASHQITKCTAASTYSPACKASYSWDSPVHLTAHHGPGYVFSVWHSSASTLCRGKQPSCATKAKGGGDAVAAIFKRSR